MKWTEDRVRAELPPVDVKPVKGAVIKNCIVAGRLHRFAGVFTKDGTPLGEWTWEAVTNSLNNGRPLLV